MTEEVALLAGIATEPTDRTAQLVYADWLAEHSRPDEMAWRWIAAFKRRSGPFRAFRVDREPYWRVYPVNYLNADEQHGGDGWLNWCYPEHESTTYSWPWSAGMSTLPSQLFKWLPRGNEHDEGYIGHRPFNSTEEAFAALVKAYMRATRPRRNRLDRFWNGKAWEPDWNLVESVPNE